MKTELCARYRFIIRSILGSILKTDYKFLAIILLFIPTISFAQISPEYSGGLKVDLSEDGKKYFRLVSMHQVWIRAIENNPGTVDVNGDPKDMTFDVGMRRSRFIFYSQLNDDFLILFQWGINNQTFTNGGGSGTGGFGGYGSGKKPQVFVHDAYTQYKVTNTIKENSGFSLYLGAGLHFWNGLSRTANQSVGTIMPVDLPVFGFQGIELTDQFARQYGIYAKGQIGKLGYRLNLNKPFIVDNRAAMSFNRAANIPTENWATAGYFEYQFLEREGNVLPYKTGTYLGTKEVFNIGGGYYYHPEASGIGSGLFVDERQDHRHFAVDLFYDRPINKAKGTALTLYSVAMLYNYGDNYFRTFGIMNVNPNGNPGANNSITGFGNTEPLLGTGLISYSMLGYLLPKSLMKKGQLQPYFVFTNKTLNYLDIDVQNYDLGINYFVSGHQAKISLQYSLRPLVTGTVGSGYEANQWASTVFIQTQISL